MNIINQSSKIEKLSGIMILFGMVAGILSISDSVDSNNYLITTAKEPIAVSLAAIFQFLLSLTYAGFAILMYPIVKKYNQVLALGFLNFRLIASTIMIVGTVLLMVILLLSQEFLKSTLNNPVIFSHFGNILKISRDYLNHVFMVFTISTGNLMLYIIFLKYNLLPRWFVSIGILGMILSTFASLLLMFQIIQVITLEYIALNMVTALFDLSLGFWLILVGLSRKESRRDIESI